MKSEIYLLDKKIRKMTQNLREKRIDYNNVTLTSNSSK